MTWDDLKHYLTGMIVQWILKVSAGVIGTCGITQDSWTLIVTAVVVFALGALLNVLHIQKALMQQPPGSQ